jgi:hypothetical protein
MIKNALIIAVVCVAVQFGIERVQKQFGWWSAANATCEGLPKILLIPVPVPTKGVNI